MPELPEVETIVRRLQDILPGKQFAKVSIHHPKSFAGELRDLEGQELIQVSRRAKVIDFHLANDLHLLTHLKMTGQVIYVENGDRVGGGHPTADWVRDLPSKHTRIEYDFDDGTKLFFNDQRIFGWMRLFTKSDRQEFFDRWGPDINDPTATIEYLYPILQRRGIPIKQAIMDNNIICGVGNIYACDALNLAKISPIRPAKSLNLAEATVLLDACKDVIQKGIDLGGTTFDGKYVGVDGFAGGYQEQILAYGREGEPCYNCAALIQKKKIGGRGTYYCGVCQV
jgi:formamidopyrimidine-DNA glycosylase